MAAKMCATTRTWRRMQIVPSAESKTEAQRAAGFNGECQMQTQS